jgi:hypothetical protein
MDDLVVRGGAVEPVPMNGDTNEGTRLVSFAKGQPNETAQVQLLLFVSGLSPTVHVEAST